MNKLGILFFHPSKLMRSLSMLQCCLYCWSNVSANRMQNLKTRFQKLCWGAAWLRQRQCQCKPNAEPENSFSKVMLRCSLTSPKAMSVQTECKTWKHVFKSYAEMQPYFATAKIQHTQPEIQICCSPNIAPRKFSKPSNEHPALCLQAFRCIFHTQKKWNRDITFHLLPIIKTYEAATFFLNPMLQPTHLFTTDLLPGGYMLSIKDKPKDNFFIHTSTLCD